MDFLSASSILVDREKAPIPREKVDAAALFTNDLLPCERPVSEYSNNFDGTMVKRTMVVASTRRRRSERRRAWRRPSLHAMRVLAVAIALPRVASESECPAGSIASTTALPPAAAEVRPPRREELRSAGRRPPVC